MISDPALAAKYLTNWNAHLQHSETYQGTTKSASASGMKCPASGVRSKPPPRMSEHFTADRFVVAEADIHPNEIYVSGRPERPVLTISLNFRFRSPTDRNSSFIFQGLRCRLSPFDESYISESLPAPIDKKAMPGQTEPVEYLPAHDHASKIIDFATFYEAKELTRKRLAGLTRKLTPPQEAD